MHATPHAEDGAATVVVALVLPFLLALAGSGFSVLVLAGAQRELQSGADAAALAAAAGLPVSDPSALPRRLLPPTVDAATIACDVAAQNLSIAPMTAAFAGSRSCADGVRVELQPDDPSLLDALESNALALESTASLAAVTGLAPPTLLPAVATPRVSVDVDGRYDPPMLQLVAPERDGVDLHTSALARRRLKNAVLLPVLALPGSCTTTVETELGPVTVEVDLSVHVSASVSLADLAARLGDCRVDLNPVLDESGAEVFTRMQDAGRRLDELGLPGTRVVDALLFDLRDVYDPRGAAPTQRELLDAADPREGVLVLLVGATQATQIPVLDAVTVLAEDLERLATGRPRVHEVLAAGRSLAEARGVFRASLFR